jgi:hypothetical protein
VGESQVFSPALKGEALQKTRESMVKMAKYPPLMSVKPFKSRLVFDHF